MSSFSRMKQIVFRCLCLVCTAAFFVCNAGTASAAAETVRYLGGDGSVQTVRAVILRQDAGTVLSESWYAVKGTVRFTEQLVTGGSDVHLILCDGATLTAEGGILVREGCTLTICAQSDGNTAGTLIAAPMEGAGIGGPEGGNGGSLVINGGRIEATGGEASAGIGGARRGSMTSITVNGGTVRATSWYPSRAGYVTTGLDTHAAGTSDSGAGIGAGYKGRTPRITINGGTVTAKGYTGNAGIGGSESYGGAGITINGGTVTAIGGVYGAGIGGGQGTAAGPIKIRGGTVLAAGVKGGAGIGGGRGNGSGNDPIEITGGTVTALAVNNTKPDNGNLSLLLDGQKYYYCRLDGAGIGGGYDGECGNVTIRGGTVRAIGGGGAGIGSGFGADMAAGSTILVTGGDITASSFGGAAGIGAGASGNASTFKITGGTVRAYGSHGDATHLFTSLKAQASAGIGGGHETSSHYGGEGGTFIYEGGTVIACAGYEYNTAIGRGFNDREMGTVRIGAGAKVSGTNSVSDYSDEKQAGQTPRTPLDDPEIAVATNRVRWCNHSRYVVIEECDHKRSDTWGDSNVRYIDSNVAQHYISGTCTFCGEVTNRYENHVFDPVTHRCACGHTEVPVTFYDDAGTAVLATQYVTAGRRVTKVPADPEPRPGFRFEGYFERSGDGTLSAAPFSPLRNVTEKTDLWQVWTRTAPDYTVRFFDENGSPITWRAASGEVISEVTVMGDTYLTEGPPLPQLRPGYYFAGYFEKDANGYTGEAFRFSQPVTKSYDLYYKWEKSELEWARVAFDSDGGTPADALTVLRGHLCTADEWPADPQKEGYLFDGWTLNGTLFDYRTTPINLPLTLKARWTPILYRVSFVTGTGEAVPAQTVRHGGKLAEGSMPAVTREGYTLLYWYRSAPAEAGMAETPYNYDRPVLSDIEMTAAWRRTYKVRYYADGRLVHEADVPEGGYAEDPLAANPAFLGEKTGERFAGWYEKDGELYFSNPYRFGAAPLDRDLSLYADWAAYYYPVTFDPRGGTFAEEGAEWQVIRYGECAQEPLPPVRDRWTFAGWLLDGAPYAFSTPVMREMTLSAEWTKMCLVRFESPEGALISSIRARSGTLIPKPADPVREGYDFKGWSPAGGKQVLWDFDRMQVADDLILRAVWLKRIAPAVSQEDWTTGETPEAPVVTGVAGESEIRYRYKAEGETEYTDVRPQAPGRYTIKALVDESDHYAAGEATAPFVILAGAEYTVISAAGTAHTLGDGRDAVITVQRSMADELTYRLFAGADIDGNPVSPANYAASPGSLVLTLKAAYLDTLAEGAHDVRIRFSDGSADAPLTILAPAAAAEEVPKTGDSSPLLLWAALVLLGILGLRISKAGQ